MAAILIGLYAVYESRRADSGRQGESVVVEEPVTSTEAQAILDRANEATEFAGLLLSFVEAASAIIAVLLAIGAYIFRRSILEEFEDAIQKVDNLEKRAQEREIGLKRREQELDDLSKRITSDIDTLTKDNRAEFAQIRDHARDSFRVVSLQLMAEQQVRAHNLATAIQTLSTAYQMEPTNPATNYLLGYLYTARKEFDRAIEHLECALNQEASFTPALAALGLALRRKGDAITDEARFEERNRLWSQAEARLLEALKLDPSLTDMDSQSYYGTLGGLYRRQTRYKDALQAYERALAVTPTSTYPIINLAALHTRLGHTEQARRYFEMVLVNAALELDDDPRNMWTRMDYVQALLVLEKPEEATSQLSMVLDQGPERGQLETVLSGLRFLSESPTPIAGLDEMIAKMEATLAGLQDNSTDFGPEIGSKWDDYLGEDASSGPDADLGGTAADG